jgi:hypothetical protein
MTGKQTSPDDPRGLIWDAYRIEGIAPQSCRSIYLDWALGMPDGTDLRAVTVRLLDRFGPDAPDHPMTAVLREGVERSATPRRRTRR